MMQYSNVLPRSRGRHNESERDRGESRDEMLTAQGTVRIQREFWLMHIGRISDGGTHIFS